MGKNCLIIYNIDRNSVQFRVLTIKKLRYLDDSVVSPLLTHWRYHSLALSHRLLSNILIHFVVGMMVYPGEPKVNVWPINRSPFTCNGHPKIPTMHRQWCDTKLRWRASEYQLNRFCVLKKYISWVFDIPTDLIKGHWSFWSTLCLHVTDSAICSSLATECSLGVYFATGIPRYLQQHCLFDGHIVSVSKT